MRTSFIFVIQDAMMLISMGLIARFYIYPRLEKLSIYKSLTILSFFSVFRCLGLTYLVPGVANALPASFTIPAAYGDFTTSLLSLVAIILLRRQHRAGIAVGWLMNIVGTLDLVCAYYLGLKLPWWEYATGAIWFFPIVLVPVLCMGHAMAFVLMVRKP
ncbi:MAG TPA: hypothetical protein VL986_15155 [Terracidiphilus sp.]|nr:hypothetical protein [Terracidiphilus sp.]